jgi:hypothetical protein
MTIDLRALRRLSVWLALWIAALGVRIADLAPKAQHWIVLSPAKALLG